MNVKLLFNSLLYLLFVALPLLGHSQNITYTITLTGVSWAGDFDDAVFLISDEPEEYGLVGATPCLNVKNNNFGSVTGGTQVLSSGTNVPRSVVGPFSFAGIENDGFLDIDNAQCSADGDDDAICTISFSIDFISDPNLQSTGSVTKIFSCTGNGGSTSVTIDVSLIALLPIELFEFSGIQQKNAIHLSWSTATEQNNDYMAVERSADGRTFQELGRVQGAGTTLEPQEYSFLDEKPLRGLNYYRLRQVDFDGAVEYHKVISVEFNGKGSAIGVSAFPNPANEMLYASWAASTEQPATLRVLDMTGRQLAQYTAQAGAASFELPLNNLPAGLYFLEVRQGSEVEVVRFRRE